MRSPIVVLSLFLASCTTVTNACDIHYVGEPPAHYVAAGEALDSVMIIELPSDEVLNQCWGDTPVGCAIPRPDLGWHFIVLTTEPERWNLTRDYIIRHEIAHLGGWNRCHNN